MTENNRLLPLERSLPEAVRIYGKRLGFMLAVIVLDALIFGLTVAVFHWRLLWQILLIVIGATIFSLVISTILKRARGQRNVFQPGNMPPVVMLPEPRLSDTPSTEAPKVRAKAWLVSDSGHTYQLNLDSTTIGRSMVNDIAIAEDRSVSRQHARIVERNGHFLLYDLGAAAGTWVNERRVHQPVSLEPDDVIRLGTHTQLRFVTSDD